jgi:hypothetical protein
MSPEIMSAIAWPASALLIFVVLGVSFLVTQRNAINRLLDRATKVSAGPAGASIEAAARAEQQQIEASKPEPQHCPHHQRPQLFAGRLCQTRVRFMIPSTRTCAPNLRTPLERAPN